VKGKQSRQRRAEYKIYHQRRKRKSYLRKKHRLANVPKSQSLKQSRKKGFFRRRQVALSLPRNFSFISAPAAVLHFFAQFRSHVHDRTDVLLDFRHVENITPDVIPLLLAKASNYNGIINISGNRPSKKEVDLMLLESGFYKLVGVTNKKPTHGLLEMHKSMVVDPQVASNARKLAAEKTFGDPSRKIYALYRTLIECMANTRKHASTRQSINWWLSVYNDPITRITSFSFCDTGIGIFKSAKVKNLTKFALALGIYNHQDILRHILEGKIPSSTGLPYRGKGLPKIYSDYKNGNIKRLFIAANDVFADFDNGIFLDLEDQLNGTFLYWEIAPN